MDPFHVVHLGAEALDECRRRIQQDTCGRRGRTGDLVYSARRTLHTGVDLLTDTQTDRLRAVFAADEHAEVHATWGVYQRMIAAYRKPDRVKGKDLMRTLIESVRHGVPAALREIIRRCAARRGSPVARRRLRHAAAAVADAVLALSAQGPGFAGGVGSSLACAAPTAWQPARTPSCGVNSMTA
jgi:hypothetical protein